MLKLIANQRWENPVGKPQKQTNGAAAVIYDCLNHENQAGKLSGKNTKISATAITSTKPEKCKPSEAKPSGKNSKTKFDCFYCCNLQLL